MRKCDTKIGLFTSTLSKFVTFQTVHVVNNFDKPQLKPSSENPENMINNANNSDFWLKDEANIKVITKLRLKL